MLYMKVCFCSTTTAQSTSPNSMIFIPINFLNVFLFMSYSPGGVLSHANSFVCNKQMETRVTLIKSVHRVYLI